MTISRYGVVTLVFAVLVGCGEPAMDKKSQRFVLVERTFSGETFSQWKLPKRLREISGLALTPDQRLFAHGDEKAVLYEVDYEDGAIVKSFALGDPPARGDFEGLAYVDERFYLVTSGGRIYVAAEGEDGSHVNYEIFDTEIGELCEIEGLTYQQVARNLLLACKRSRDKALDGAVTVIRWSIDTERVERTPPIRVELAEVLEKTGGKRFEPSGITCAGPDRLLLIAAGQRSVLEIDLDGRVIDAFKLPLAKFHPQPEGIAWGVAGELIFADEGGNKRGRLGVYRPAG